jgi:predicted secreted protein
MSRLKMIVLLVVLTILLSLNGCSASRTPEVTPAPKEVQLTQKGGACGSGVGLNEGDTLVLILEGDPSSDYTWEVGFYVPAVIEPVGEPIVQSKSSSGSASDTYTFRFLAVGEGEAELHMIYGPPEKDSPEFKTCQLTVTVK